MSDHGASSVIESKRVLYTFVELYLRMGYFQLAKTYYDMYMFDANAYDSRHGICLE